MIASFQFVKQNESPKKLLADEKFARKRKSYKSVVVNGIPLHTEQFDFLL